MKYIYVLLERSREKVSDDPSSNIINKMESGSGRRGERTWIGIIRTSKGILI